MVNGKTHHIAYNPNTISLSVSLSSHCILPSSSSGSVQEQEEEGGGICSEVTAAASGIEYGMEGK